MAGLIYLDCYGYAYYDHSQGWFDIDLNEIIKKLELLRSGTGKEDPRHLVQELLETSLPGFEKDLRELQSEFQAMSAAEVGQWSKPLPAAQLAIQDGEQHRAPGRPRTAGEMDPLSALYSFVRRSAGAGLPRC